MTDQEIPADVTVLAEDIADHCGGYVTEDGVDYIAERLYAAILAERARCASIVDEQIKSAAEALVQAEVKTERERSKTERLAAWASLRMVADAIGELFGPAASIESEDASLLRGPEFHHFAEGIIVALQRVAAAPEQRFRLISTLIQAAGGKIVITAQMLRHIDETLKIERVEDAATRDITYRVVQP